MKVLLDQSTAVVQVNPRTGNPDKRVKTGSFRRWQPKVWTPVMEQMVVLACANHTNISIAAMFRVSPQHVSNVLNCDEGIKLRNQIVDNIRSNAELTINERMKALAARAIQNVEDVVKNKKLLEDSPFAVFDRSIKVLEATKHIESPKAVGAGGVNIERAIIVSSEQAKQLTDGLLKANEAAILHGNIEVLEKKSAEPSK